MQQRIQYKDVATLRQQVSAKDKSDCFEKDVDEGVKIVVEKYETTEPAARAFIHYLKGIKDGDPKATKGATLEKLHKVWNAKRGAWEDGPLAT